jgi:hypothetical protein
MGHETSHFYVYGHFRPDGSLFYIGKGCGTRAWDKNKRTKEWYNEAGEAYEVCLLEGFDLEKAALDYEKELHELFGISRNGGILCNQLIGGGAPTEYRDIWKAKISKAHTGKKLTQEHIAKMTLWPKGHTPWNAGKTTSEEAKAKMRAAKLGKKRGPYSEEHRAAISRGNTGGKRSAETRANIGASKRGIKQSEETKRKRALALTGQKRSPESRLKMSIAARARVVSPEARAKMSAARKGVPWSASRRQRSMEVSL